MANFKVIYASKLDESIEVEYKDLRNGDTFYTSVDGYDFDMYAEKNGFKKYESDFSNRTIRMKNEEYYDSRTSYFTDMLQFLISKNKI